MLLTSKRWRKLLHHGIATTTLAASLIGQSYGQEPVLRAVSAAPFKAAQPDDGRDEYRTASNQPLTLVDTQDTQSYVEPSLTEPNYAASTLTHQVVNAVPEQEVGTSIPATSQYAPWWEQQVGGTSRGNANPVSVSVNQLIVSALQNSAQIKVFSDLPLIRETAITEADAAFDWVGFMESRWDDTNEPVGSVLTTGGPPRFKDNNFGFSMGTRRRSTLGGQLEISQRIGYQNNNSVFFLPNDQGTSRLTMSYTQPLLRGAGRVYNTSLTVLAGIDTEIARNEFSRQLQSHLLEVTRAYWSLYLERAGLLQKQKLLTRAEEILQDLEQRQELDAVHSQVVRARSAVASRRSEILRSEMAVRNAESQIRALTNDPNWGCDDNVELLPVDTPFRAETPVEMDGSVACAMRNRPEIGQAVKQVKASCVRMNMAKNEILPVLNMVLETYLSGLKGDSRVGDAWTAQFNEGAPSYSVGLQYEVPIWNRAAKARLQRRRLEVRQLQNQFQTTTETLKLEVAVAVRELMTSFREMDAKGRAMGAANTEVEYISERWKALGAEDRSASLMLEDLLNAQARLADAEFGYLTSSVTYNLAQMNYKKAVGTLLQQEFISVCRNCNCCLPGQTAQKSGGFCNACINGEQMHSAPMATSHPVYDSQSMVNSQPITTSEIQPLQQPGFEPQPSFTEPTIETGISIPPAYNSNGSTPGI